MRLAIIAGVLLAASAAQAEGGFTVQAMLGLTGETEYDDTFEYKANGQKGKAQFAEDSDTVEGNFGLAGTYEFDMTDRITLGPRLAFATGKTDDSELVMRTIDIGGIGRFFFNDGDWRGFGALALGATYAMVKDGEIGTQDLDADMSGIGFHVMPGVGLEGKVGTSVSVIGGLYYCYQSVSEIEGDINIGQKVDATIEDTVLTRVMLLAGVAF